MLKKFFNRFKKKSEESKVLEIKENVINKDEKIVDTLDEISIKKEELKLENEEKEINIIERVDNLEQIINNAPEAEAEAEAEAEELDDEDKRYIIDAKIKRGRSIKAIDVYNNEEQIFDTHKQCSKVLKLPIEYIAENLRHGHTDYLGEAIKYLSKELRLSEYSNDYTNNNKSPLEIYNDLNNKIFTLNISESKRDDILSNNKIDPIKMHYKFECLDEEYDRYYIKYKSIIKRGGKKKIELLNSKGEVIEVFKSLDDCSKYLNKSKSEITSMLKYKENKVGRYEIRYSLRNI
ncbi:MAG: hypothetical protein ACLRSF_02780 [Romboutsia timonensis]|uniref:hypothetical protein n=1 Tax=Romboutsia timonensis TaxID=1776391 RepID=UPI00399089B1